MRLFKRFMLVMCACVLLAHTLTYASEVDDLLEDDDCYVMKATAYSLHGTMCKGGQTRIGVCATSLDYYGYVAIVYEYKNGTIGDFIGMYECLDTGGKNIRSGKVLDIWMPTDAECFQFGRRDVLVKYVKGVG